MELTEAGSIDAAVDDEGWCLSWWSCTMARMTIELLHHPFSRASTVLWMLEEVGVPYVTRFVDFKSNGQKAPDVLALNPMGKLPTLVDGDAVVSEVAAIGLYLADRYAPGRLSPAIDSPERGAYYRYSIFPSAVIEPASLAKLKGFEVASSTAGWGDYESMLASTEAAIAGRPYLLGDEFSMADLIFGATLRYMIRFKMIEPRPSFTAYVDRLNDRPASQRAEAKNSAIAKEHGLI